MLCRSIFDYVQQSPILKTIMVSTEVIYIFLSFHLRLIQLFITYESVSVQIFLNLIFDKISHIPSDIFLIYG